MDDQERLPPPAGAIRRTSASLPILIGRISEPRRFPRCGIRQRNSDGFRVAFHRERAYSLFGSASPADRSVHVRNSYSLGPDHPRLSSRARLGLDRDPMDSVAARLSAAARRALVTGSWVCRSICRPLSFGGGLLTTPMRHGSSLKAPLSRFQADSSPSWSLSRCRSGGRGRQRESQPTVRRDGREREIRSAGLLRPDGVLLGCNAGTIFATMVPSTYCASRQPERQRCRPCRADAS